MGEIARHRAVIVILRDDDIGGLIPAKLADFFNDPAQNLVVEFRRVD